jgi:hypothetical protein
LLRYSTSEARVLLVSQCPQRCGMKHNGRNGNTFSCLLEVFCYNCVAEASRVLSSLFQQNRTPQQRSESTTTSTTTSSSYHQVECCCQRKAKERTGLRERRSERGETKERVWICLPSRLVATAATDISPLTHLRCDHSQRGSEQASVEVIERHSSSHLLHFTVSIERGR